ncbi:MAG: RNA polymerase sigma factor [Sandaracinaceae bacterium]
MQAQAEAMKAHDDPRGDAALAAMAADPIALLIREGRHRDAVALCAREHAAAVGRLCMALLGNQAEAEETVQEVLIAAHAGMEGFRAEGTVRGWLCGIARRKCARKLETRVRRERRLRLVHDAAQDAQLPDDVLDTRRRAERVREALELLKPSERDAVVLRYESGLAYREIGEACGIDEAAARKRVSRALARMKSLLEEAGR